MNRSELTDSISNRFNLNNSYVKAFLAYTVRLPHNGFGYKLEIESDKRFGIVNERTGAIWKVELEESPFKELVNRQFVNSTKLVLCLKQRVHYGDKNNSPNALPHPGRNETGHYLSPSKD